MKLRLDANPKSAPTCVMLLVVLNHESRSLFKGSLRRGDVPTVLFQTDYEWPYVASLFGWSPANHPHQNGCRHLYTDGTVACQQCAMSASDFIDAARKFIDEKDGETCHCDHFDSFHTLQGDTIIIA